MKIKPQILLVFVLLMGFLGGNLLNPSETIGCDAPTSLKVEKITQTTAWLQWNRVEGGKYYELQMAKGNDNFSSSMVISGNRYPLTLTDGEMYRFRVRALCSDVVNEMTERSSWTNLSWNNSGNHCPAPISLVASNVTSRTAIVTWKTSYNAARYLVNYRVVGEPNYKTIYTSRQMAMLSDLNSNSRYEVQVSSLCENNQRSAVAVYYFQTQNNGHLTCVTPTNLRFTDIRSFSFTSTWDAVVGASGYEVWYRVNYVGEWKSIITNENKVTIQNLLSNIPYSIKVRTLCNETGDLSLWSNEYVTTSGNAETPSNCLAPFNINVQLYGMNAGTISWYGTTGATKYEVLLSMDGKNFAIAATSPYSFANLPNLMAGRYWVKVRSICGDNASNDSPIVQFRTGLNKELNGEMNSEVSVYPNPAKGSAFISLPSNENVKVTLVDAQGRNVLTQNISSTSNEINLSSLTSGIYMVNLSGETIQQTTKLVVE